MRHKKGFNHLSRKKPHRKAMLGNMAPSLIIHKRIKTTVAKAKALKQYVEPLVTKSKNDTTHSRRVVFGYLQDKKAVGELFREVAVKIADRPGGYTRILKIGNRLGDNAEMCYIELVDYNENLLVAQDEKHKTTRRRRGSGKAKTTETAVEETTDVEVATQEVVDEVKEVKSESKVEEDNLEEPKAEAKEEEKTELEKKPKAEAKEDVKSEKIEESKDELKAEDKKV